MAVRILGGDEEGAQDEAGSGDEGEAPANADGHAAGKTRQEAHGSLCQEEGGPAPQCEAEHDQGAHAGGTRSQGGRIDSIEKAAGEEGGELAVVLDMSAPMAAERTVGSAPAESLPRRPTIRPRTGMAGSFFPRSKAERISAAAIAQGKKRWMEKGSALETEPPTAPRMAPTKA